MLVSANYIMSELWGWKGGSVLKSLNPIFIPTSHIQLQGIQLSSALQRDLGSCAHSHNRCTQMHIINRANEHSFLVALIFSLLPILQWNPHPPREHIPNSMCYALLGTRTVLCSRKLPTHKYKTSEQVWTKYMCVQRVKGRGKEQSKK